MKKLVILLVLLTVTLTVPTACSGNNLAESNETNHVVSNTYDYQQNNQINEQPPQSDILAGQTSSPICFDTVSYLFEQLDAILDADGGSLWGIDLQGPIVFADATSRYAVANMPDVDGEIFTRQGNLYVGMIPEDIRIATWNVYLGGRFWAMVSWEQISTNADETEQNIGIMLHKLFHTHQHSLFEGLAYWAFNDHLDELDARISARLELNALLYAMRTTGEERSTTILDALSIRAERHRNNTDDVRGEVGHEIAEGTAVYTEVTLLFDNLEDRLRHIEGYIHEEPDIRLFTYYTGAFYALLLDEFDVDWRTGLDWGDDLAAMLKVALGFERVIPFNEIDLERYGYSLIRPVEETWATEQGVLVQMAEEAFSGPLLIIDALGELNDWEADIKLLNMDTFAPNNYDEFDYGQEEIYWSAYNPQGHRLIQPVFYGDFIYTGAFGQLEAKGGLILIWHLRLRHSIPAYDIEVDGNIITGPNWVLTLNDGFGLREVGGGHFAIGQQ